MMKLKLALLALVGFPMMALANPRDVMTCTTHGDALDSVDLAVNTVDESGDYVLISVTYESAEMVGFTADMVKGVFDQGLENGHLVVVGKTHKSSEFGGGVSNAALLVLDKVKGTFGGQLAVDGTVYTLECKSY